MLCVYVYVFVFSIGMILRCELFILVGLVYRVSIVYLAVFRLFIVLVINYYLD